MHKSAPPEYTKSKVSEAMLVAVELDEEVSVAERVAAFRAAQFAVYAGALDALCAAELSYSRSGCLFAERPTFV